MKNIAMAAGGCLLLAACSSGGGGAVVPPSPTPTATASPTPTPSPSGPTYTKFADLAGDQNFRAACGSMWQADATQVPSPQGMHMFNLDMLLRYAAGTQTYTAFRYSSAYSQTFEPATRDAGTPADTISFTKAIAGGQSDRLSIQTPMVAGVAAEYVRLSGQTLSSTRQYCVIGVPTLTTDTPSATLVTFTTFSITGTAYDKSGGTLVNYDLGSSTAQMVVDLSTGEVRPTLRLIGKATGLPDKDFGTFPGSAGIDTSTGGYMGTMSTAFVPGTVTQLAGGFFGPQGKEAGMAFSLSRNPLGAPSDLTITGTMIARR